MDEVRNEICDIINKLLDDILNGKKPNGKKVVDELYALTAQKEPVADVCCNDGLCCKTMLRECRDAIDSLPIDSLGEGSDGKGMTWPIRDELIDKITKCLNAT